VLRPPFALDFFLFQSVFLRRGAFLSVDFRSGRAAPSERDLFVSAGIPGIAWLGLVIASFLFVTPD